MSDHVSEARMHEALDGELSAAESERLDRHLEGCAACRDTYARLSEVVAAVRALPRSARTPEDAWAAIRARIEGVDREDPDDEVRVLTLPTRATGDQAKELEASRSRSSIAARGVRMSVPQLAAAAAVVALVSAGTMRLAMGGGSTAVEPIALPTAPPGGAAARAVSLEGERYTETVAQLEEILDQGRSVLAPETVATIEASLETVDAAIAEVERALAEDPGSDLLQRLLASHQSRKLGVLQRAVGAVQAST